LFCSHNLFWSTQCSHNLFCSKLKFVDHYLNIATIYFAALLAPFGFYFFRDPNLRKKKQVKIASTSLMTLLSNLTVRTILQNLCKDRDYFLHFKRKGTNLQSGYKDRDQNAYSLQMYQIKLIMVKNSWKELPSFLSSFLSTSLDATSA